MAYSFSYSDWRKKQKEQPKQNANNVGTSSTPTATKNPTQRTATNTAVKPYSFSYSDWRNQQRGTQPKTSLVTAEDYAAKIAELEKEQKDLYNKGQEQIDTLKWWERLSMAGAGVDWYENPNKEAIDNIGKEIENLQAGAWESKQRETLYKLGQSGYDAAMSIPELEWQIKNLRGMTDRESLAQIQELSKELNAARKQLDGFDDDVKQSLLDYADRKYNAQVASGRQKEIAESIDDSGWNAAALSVFARPAANLAGGVMGTAEVVGQNLKKAITGSDTPIDYNRQGMQLTQNARTITEETVKKIEEGTEGWKGSDTKLFGNLYSAAYQLGMSVEDSAITAGLNAVGIPNAGYLLGASATANAVLDAKERGATDGQALLSGVMQGIAEGFFEQVSIDQLFTLSSPIGASTRESVANSVKNIAKQMLTEGSEETFTTIANTITDLIINGDVSNIRFQIQQLEDSGVSPEEARKIVTSEWFKGLLGDFVGGSISGGLFGSASNIVTGYQTIQQGKNIRQQGNAEALLALASQLDESMKSAQAAQELNPETAKNAQLGYLYNQVQADTLEQAVKQRLDFLQVTDETAVSAAVKSIRGENLNRSERQALNSTPQVQRVVSEYSGMAERNGLDPENAWAYDYADKVTDYQNMLSKAWQAPESPQGGYVDYFNKRAEYIKNHTPIAPAKAESATAQPQTASPIDEVANKYGKQAGAVRSIYNLAPTQDIEGFAKAFDALYQVGLEGGDRNVIMQSELVQGLTRAQRELAYDTGASVLMASEISSQTRKSSAGDLILVGMSTGDVNRRFKHDSNQKLATQVLRSISRATGLTIALFDSNGDYSKEQGSFDWGSDVISIDIAAGITSAEDVESLAKYVMLRVFAHEFTHVGEKWAPEEYNILRTTVIEALSAHKDFDLEYRIGEIQKDDYKARKARYIAEGMEESAAAERAEQEMLSWDEASREVVAEAMTDVLPESQFMKSLYEKSPKVANKLREALRRFLARVKMYFKGLVDNPSREAQALKVELDGTVKYLEGIVEKWDAMALAAVENYNKAPVVETSESVMERAETATAENLTTKTLGSVVDSDGKKVFSFRTMKQDLDFYMQDLVEAGLVGEGKAMSEAELNELYTSINRVMNYVEKNLEEIERNEAYREMDGTNRPFLPYKDNSDPHYRMALDYSTLCRKRLLTQAITERLQASLKRALTPVEQVKIRNEIKKLQAEGKKIDVACALCYVEAARLKSPKVINEFLNNKSDSLKNYFSLKNKTFKNEVYQRRLGDWKEAKGLARNATKNDIKNAGYKVADFNKFAKEVRNDYWSWLEKSDPETFAKEKAIIDTAESMDNEKFLSAADLAKMRRDIPELYDAFIFKVRSATRSKAQETDVPYKRGDINQVGQAIIEQMNEESGFRHQSWSDFQAMHLLDTIAAIIELSTKKAKVHTYTKVADMVRFLGETGMMINMSLIPNGNTGMNEDGTLDFDPVEGMDYDVMINLRDMFPDTAGNIAIGISDEQILALLASPNIDYVIPYHTSGLNADMRRRMGIKSWKDYTKTQNESGDGDAPTLREWFDEKEAQSYADGYEYMVKASEKYLELCHERGLTPKFAQFLKKGADGKYSLKDDARNYWKLLVDRKMVNHVTKGVIIQQAVIPKFNEDTMLDILDAEVNSEAARDAREAEDIIVNKLMNEPVVFTKAELEQARLLRDAAIRLAIEDSAPRKQYSRRNYWHPKLTPAEWDTLNAVINREVDEEKNYIDTGTKWLYNVSKGNKLFAIYSSVYADDPTVLYASSGNLAETEMEILSTFLEEFKNANTDRVGETFGAWVETVGVQRARNGGNSGSATYPRRATGNDGLDVRTPKRHASPAFESVLKNLTAHRGAELGIIGKTQFSRRDSGHDTVARAKEYFGTTDDPYKAGYMLADGTMLNFRNEGNRLGWDQEWYEEIGDHIDHHVIYEVYGDKYESDPLEAVDQFVSEGNIRLVFSEENTGENAIEVSSTTKPTAAQYDMIRQLAEQTFLEMKRLTVGYVGAKHYRKTYDEYSKGSTVVNDIKYYHANGKQRDSVAQGDIRYSRRTQSYTDREVLELAEDIVSTRSLTEGEREALNIFNKRLATLKDLQEQRDRQRELLAQENRKATPDEAEKRKILNRLIVLGRKIKAAENSVLSVENKQVLKKVLHEARGVVEREQRDIAETRTNTEKYKARIFKEAKTLSNWLRKNSDKEHVPEVLKKPVAELLAAIDFSSKRFLSGGELTQADEKFRENLAALQTLIQGQQGVVNGDENAVDNVGAYLDLSVENRQFLDELVNTLSKTSGTFTINEMSAEQLKSLSKFLQNLATAIRKANKTLANARYQNIPDMAYDSIKHFEEIGNAKVTDSLKAVKFISWTNATPYYAFKRFGAAGEALFDGFTRGWEKLAMNAQEVINFTNKTYKAEESRKWKTDVRDITLESGKKIQMTIAQIMELSQLLNREQARKHIEAGGIRIGNIEGKLGAVKQDTNHYHLTAEDITKIVGLLTQRQLKVAEQMRKYMGKRGGEWGNEISMARFGYEFYTEGEDYYTIRTDANGRPLKDTDAQSNSMFRLLNLSSSKSLNPNAKNALIVGDIFDTFADHMADMAKLNALGLPILDAIKWYNFTERTNNADGTMDEEGVKKAMETAFGAAGQKYFTQLIKDINGTTESGDRGGGFGSKLVSNYKIAAVAANLRVALLQPTSYVRASYVLKPSSLIEALLFKKNAYEDAMKYSGTAVWKSLGYYDTDIAQSLRSQIEHDETFGDWLKDKSMILAEWGDKRTWGRLWVACKLEAKSRNKSLTGEALNQATADVFREVIYATQVMDSTLTRSEIMRGSSRWTKAMTAFMSEPTLSANMLMDAASQFEIDSRKTNRQKAWAKNKNKIGLAFTVYVASAAAAAVVESIADAFRDDDEYENFVEKFLQAFIGEDGLLSGNFAQNLTIVGKIPILKDVIDTLKGSKRSDMGTASIEAVSTAYKIWAETAKLANGTLEEPTSVTWNGKMTEWGKIYKTLQALSQLSGFAVSNLTRDVVAIWNTLIAPFASGKKIKTYDAGAKNNIKYAVQDGTLTEEEATQLLLEQEIVADEDEAYWTIQGWEAGNGYSRYDAVYDAVRNGTGFDEAMAELTSHGYTEDKVTSQVKSKIREWYKGGEVSKTQAVEMMTKYLDMSNDDITKEVNKWSAVVVTGIEYDDIDDAFLNGEITADRAVNMYTLYGGMAKDTAQNKVGELTFKRDFPELDGVITYTQYKRWQTDGKPNGVSLELFTDVAEFRDNGTSNSVRSQDEVAQYIESVASSRKARHALWCCFYKASTSPWR